MGRGQVQRSGRVSGCVAVSLKKNEKNTANELNFLVGVCVCVWTMVAWLRALGAALLCKGVNVVAFSGQW